MSSARTVAERYVEAVNGREADALLAVFAADAVLRHPSGTYEGAEKIRAFYEDLVFAGQPRLTIERLLADGAVAMAEISATSPFGAEGNRQHVIDVFRLDGAGKIAELSIYYR